MKSSFFVVILLLIYSSIAGAADAPSVKNLGANESLVVDYSTSGCFHSAQSIFIFTSGKVSIYSVERKSPEDKMEDAELNKKHLGDVELSDDEITRLDALFKFYADGPGGGCTTVDHIAVSAQKDGKVLKTYDFTDGSCTTFNKNTILTLGELMGRVKK